MEDTKGWYASRGVWGSVVTVASIAFALIYGTQIDADTQKTLADQIVALVTAIGTLGGSIVALYGRLKATKRIG